MARVFSAIDIEDKNILSELESIQDDINLGLTRVPPRKMHITLEFFKDIDDHQIEKVKTGLENIDTKPFSANIKDIGAFPSEDYIRVVWAGAENHSIRELQKQAASHPVNSSDRNSFKPHITFLRVNGLSQTKKTKLQRSIKEFRDHYVGELEVNKVKLFESRLTPTGSEYKELYVKNL